MGLKLAEEEKIFERWRITELEKIIEVRDQWR